jgi:PDZ domain
LSTSSAILAMEITNSHGEKEVIVVDTGDQSGISLNSREWREWTATHTNRLKTLTAYYTPGAGLQVREEVWAKEISFGRLILTDVSIHEASVDQVAIGSAKCRASFGLAALKRLDLIVDGKKGVAYLKPKKTPAGSYQHNRIGAVFVPADLEKSDDLIAQVLDGSPAFEAGIRNGDVLLRIEKYDITRWRTSSEGISPNQTFESAAGSKVNLTLKRGVKEYQTTVVLRDLIGPNVSNLH